MVEQRCRSCGLEYSSINPPDAVVALRSFPRRYRAAFAAGDEADDRDGGAAGSQEQADLDELVRRRPPSGGWSALEYAAHVRDVIELYEGRIKAVLGHDRPVLTSVDVDELAADRRYNDQALRRVIDALEANATSMAATVRAVPDDCWSRVGLRDGEEVDVLWLVRQTVHEGAHHLRDITRVLSEVRSTR